MGRQRSCVRAREWEKGRLAIACKQRGSRFRKWYQCKQVPGGEREKKREGKGGRGGEMESKSCTILHNTRRDRARPRLRGNRNFAALYASRMRRLSRIDPQYRYYFSRSFYGPTGELGWICAPRCTPKHVLKLALTARTVIPALYVRPG